MDPRFEFYEEVRIITRDSAKSQLIGKLGYVVGRTKTEDESSWYYAVDVAGERDGYCFFESELEPTGRKFQREDFYDGASVRVRVDTDGRGHLSK